MDIPISGQLSESSRVYLHSMTAVRALALLLLGVNFMSCVEGGSDEFVLVSDVDDTVKVTNVLDFRAAARNAVASKVGFAGMPQLYRELLGANSTAERLEFVSGSPRVILSHKVHEFLDEAHFPPYRLTLRGRIRSTYNYKSEHLREMYQTSQKKFILIGDDTESDPAVYADFAIRKPTQVLAIYIHRITGRPLPKGNISFVTAYDIALNEYKEGRLNEEQAVVVGAAVLSSQGPAFLPGFQKCPEEHKTQDLPAFLEELGNKIDNKLTNICAGRHPTQARLRDQREG